MHTKEKFFIDSAQGVCRSHKRKCTIKNSTENLHRTRRARTDGNKTMIPYYIDKAMEC